jgi:hypothetical protein
MLKSTSCSRANGPKPTLGGGDKKLAEVKEPFNHGKRTDQLLRGSGHKFPVIRISDAQDLQASSLDEVIKGFGKCKHANHTKRIAFRDASNGRRLSIHGTFNQDGSIELAQHGHPRVNNQGRKSEVNHQGSQQTSVKDVETFGNVQHKSCQGTLSSNLA